MSAETLKRCEVEYDILPFICTKFTFFTPRQILLGHTEDSHKELLNYIYIVSACIKEEPQGKLAIQNENFTALCYAGHLPGFCMGYNHHGLVFSINVICPKKILGGKTRKCSKHQQYLT